MTTTTLFRTNKTQAVRLPKAVAFDDKVTAVDIRIVGKSRLITPVGAGWADWFESNQSDATVEFPDRLPQGHFDQRESL